MKIAVLILRSLLGLLFCVSGVFGFLPMHVPSQPGLAGQFQAVYFHSHYVMYVDGLQFIAGLLLLINRYVPVALTVLAGIIVNILIFHLTMALSGIVPGLIVAIIWAFLVLQYRSYFEPLFVARAVAGKQQECN